MKKERAFILTINGGSSSIKFARYKVGKRYPNLLQVACFDTAFHSTMPRVAKLLPIPRRFDKIGIQRYGFHGLSYAYLIEELVRVAGKRVANGRVILKSEKLTPKQFNNLINHESGLLGISETSSDMRDLLAEESDDTRAAEAVELFCYQAKKWIGAFAAALGGLDTLVFAGGIGENCPLVRSRICEGMGFLGIGLNEKQNRNNAAIISKKKKSVPVRVIHTDEEWMIAKTVSQVLNLT